MGVTSIPNTFYDTTLTVKRRAITLNAVGESTEIFSDIALNLKGTIQPLTIYQKKQLAQGDEFTAEFLCFAPVDVVTIKNGDRIVDDGSSKVYTVIAVEEFRAARSSITVGHHYELYLEIPKDTKS